MTEYVPTPVSNLYTTMSSYIYDASSNYIYVSTYLGMKCNDLYERLRNGWPNSHSNYTTLQLENAELYKDDNLIPKSDSLLCHLSNISTTSELSYCRFNMIIPESFTSTESSESSASSESSESDLESEYESD